MSARSVDPPRPFGDCPCSGVTLAKLLQPAVMMILTKGPLHGYCVVEAAARTPILAGSRPDRTGVYRVLRSLERRGFVVSSWDLSPSGPARKSYRLTREGRQCLARWVETLEQYHRAIGNLLSAARKASARAGKQPRRREGSS
jgi:DNA-binding PadR family transcriptional regulator